MCDLFFKNNFSGGLFADKKVYIVFGPTGTGKTSFAVDLAKKIDAEIINCDMAQIYSSIRIGVGLIKEEEKGGVQHYLFGFLREPSLLSVYEMRIEIELKIAFILAKNKNVLIVGGSSFCVYSLFFAPSLFYTHCSYDYIFSEEKKTKKCLVLGYSEKEKINKDFMVFLPKFDYVVIFFDLLPEGRERWMNNVKKRIGVFLEEGWIEEIEGMNSEWTNFLLQKKFIGYSELIHYINNVNELSFQEVKDIIFFRTCQYGKKQRTFLRKMKRDFIANGVLCIENCF